MCPHIDHENFCEAVENAFIRKWSPSGINRKTLTEQELMNIPKLK
jgi:hypothetical protein